MLAVFAAFEREILQERVRAGLAHARQNGKKLGRPMTAGLHADRIRKLHRAGVSKSEIGRRLHVGRTSVRRILAGQDFRVDNEVLLFLLGGGHISMPRKLVDLHLPGDLNGWKVP
jgi:hypothetical protein